jgi:hypothetical protein
LRKRSLTGTGTWMAYLDSFDDLKAAVAFYHKRGFLLCACYNGDLQATVLLRKKIK